MNYRIVARKIFILLVFVASSIFLNATSSSSLPSNKGVANQVKKGVGRAIDNMIINNLNKQIIGSSTVIPNGTAVIFSVSVGYPSIIYTYCGVIVSWNGASYNIRVDDRMYYNIDEDAVIRGC